MDRPWFPMYSRDWLDNKELRRCSPTARSVMADLMCLAHEGIPYGFLADKVGPLTIQYMASRCVMSAHQFLKSIAELKNAGDRLGEKDGVLFVPRLVEDERIRCSRAAGGSKSIGHPNTHPPKKSKGYQEGYPSDHPSLLKKGGGRSDSDYVYDSSVVEVSKKSEKVSWEEINELWKWLVPQYRGYVNEFMDQRLLISVVDDGSDIEDLRQNLPLWNASSEWADAQYIPNLQNFLSKRIFKTQPKVRSQNGNGRKRSGFEEFQESLKS